MNTSFDSPKLIGQRKKLIDILISKGINNNEVLSAIEKIPRHLFLGKGFENKAYLDEAFPIESGQTISQPYTVAVQSQLLEVKKGDKILEIGTGSGYQTAILCELGAEVYSIERYDELTKSALKILKELKYTPNCFIGDGTIGLPKFAPFNKIIITAAAPQFPDALIQQLDINGLMVAPIGDLNHQTMTVLCKKVDNKFTIKRHGTYRFVPLIGKYGWDM